MVAFGRSPGTALIGFVFARHSQLTGNGADFGRRSGSVHGYSRPWHRHNGLAIRHLHHPEPRCGVGAAMAGAFKVGSRPEMKRKNIVVIRPSFAERYLSTALFEGL